MQLSIYLLGYSIAIDLLSQLSILLFYIELPVYRF